MNQSKSKLGFNVTWSMAVGGMVGGGIFDTRCGCSPWAWLSFVAAGPIALTASYSYVKLSRDLVVNQTQCSLLYS